MKVRVVLFLVASLVFFSALAACAATTEYLSVGYAGGPAQSATVTGIGLSMSADGRYVAFTSRAANLVPGDTNDADDVFVRDRLLGITERVSVGPSGVEGDRYSECASMSADGRYVAFISTSATLAPGAPLGRHVFVRDRWARTTTPIRIGWRGPLVSAERLALSGNGRYLVFSTRDALLGWPLSADRDNWLDVYVCDRLTGRLVLASANSAGQKGNANSGYYSVGISANGRFVVFDSEASNLVAGDSSYGGTTAGGDDIFVRDLVLKRTDCMTLSATGVVSNRACGFGSISGDGRYVAFADMGADLLPGSYPQPQIYLRDRFTYQLEIVSLNPAGEPGNGPTGPDAVLSLDGRFVVFQSEATDLVAADTNGVGDVFVRDRLSGLTQRVSVSSAGEQGNAFSGYGLNLAVSADGGDVAFVSEATNLTAEGAPGHFLRSGIVWP